MNTMGARTLTLSLAAGVPVTATPVLPDDPDYARMWDKVNEQNSNRYNGYQKRTTRAIPIVRLTPRSGGS